MCRHAAHALDDNKNEATGDSSVSVESTVSSPNFRSISQSAFRRRRRFFSLWPGGVVPYEIAPHYDEWERSVILSAMAEFPKHTCISFRPRTANDRYYLAINKYYNLERYGYLLHFLSFGVEGVQ